MLKIGDLCLVTGGDMAGREAIPMWPIAAKSEDYYGGFLIRNHTSEVMWVCDVVSIGEEWVIPQRHLMPLRGDENPTTELSDVQRSDTVVA